MRQRWAAFLNAYPIMRPILGLVGIGACWEAFQFGFQYMAVTLPLWVTAPLAFGGLYGLVYLVLTAVTQWSARTKNIWATIVVLLVTISVADQLKTKYLAWRYPVNQSNHVALKQESDTVYVFCTHGQIFPIAKGVRFKVVGIQAFADYITAIQELEYGKDGIYPEKMEFGTLEKCEVTNYSSAPLGNVVLFLNVEFREAIASKTNQSVQSGNVLATRQTPITIPTLDSPKGQATFYIHNQSKLFIREWISETGKGIELPNNKERPIAVVQPRNPLGGSFLNPKL